MTIRVIQPEGVTTAAPFYSPAVLAQGQQVLFISGQGPKNYEADIEIQIRETFEQIRSIVEAAGGAMGDITMIRVYFLDMSRDLEAFRKVRQEFLVEPYPAATAVGVTELAVHGLQVEIEAVAVLDG